MTLKTVGYWTNSKNHELPHPRLFVDDEWQSRSRDAIVNYLKNGVMTLSWLGYETDLFDGKTKKEMGCSNLSDGVWSWPEGLWVYVERYHVRLPDEFIEHMEANGFRVPDSLDGEALVDEPKDPEFWHRWCREELAKLKGPESAR